MAKTHSREESDRAFQAHLAEFHSVRDEIIFLSTIQTQLINYTLAIVGAVITLFAISLSTTGRQLNVFDQAPVILLVAASLISILSLMSFDAEIRIQDLGRYLQFVIAPKAQGLIGKPDSPEYQALAWEETRSRHSASNTIKGFLSGVKYIVVYIPVLLFLLIFSYLRPPGSNWTPLESSLFWINIVMASLLIMGLLFIVARDWARGKKQIPRRM